MKDRRSKSSAISRVVKDLKDLRARTASRARSGIGPGAALRLALGLPTHRWTIALAERAPPVSKAFPGDAPGHASLGCADERQGLPDDEPVCRDPRDIPGADGPDGPVAPSPRAAMSRTGSRGRASIQSHDGATG